MNSIKQYLFKKIFLNTIVKNLVEILDYMGTFLGPNGSKTFLGVVALALSITKALFPHQAEFIDPVYSALGLDHEDMVVGSAIYMVGAGYAHKLIKWLKAFIEAGAAAKVEE